MLDTMKGLHRTHYCTKVPQTQGSEVVVCGFADRVMETYRGLSEEERSGNGSEAYREHFKELLEDPEYGQLLGILPTFAETE